MVDENFNLVKDLLTQEEYDFLKSEIFSETMEKSAEYLYVNKNNIIKASSTPRPISKSMYNYKYLTGSSIKDLVTDIAERYGFNDFQACLVGYTKPNSVLNWHHDPNMRHFIFNIPIALDPPCNRYVEYQNGAIYRYTGPHLANSTPLHRAWTDPDKASALIQITGYFNYIEKVKEWEERGLLLPEDEQTAMIMPPTMHDGRQYIDRN